MLKKVFQICLHTLKKGLYLYTKKGYPIPSPYVLLSVLSSLALKCGERHVQKIPMRKTKFLDQENEVSKNKRRNTHAKFLLRGGFVLASVSVAGFPLANASP